MLTSIFIAHIANTNVGSISKDQNSFLKLISNVSRKDLKENANDCDKPFKYASVHDTGYF